MAVYSDIQEGLHASPDIMVSHNITETDLHNSDDATTPQFIASSFPTQSSKSVLDVTSHHHASDSSQSQDHDVDRSLISAHIPVQPNNNATLQKMVDDVNTPQKIPQNIDGECKQNNSKKRKNVRSGKPPFKSLMKKKMKITPPSSANDSEVITAAASTSRKNKKNQRSQKICPPKWVI